MSTETQPEVPRKRGGFLRQSSTSSMAALLAMLSGLLLDVVLASKFGAGRTSDAFFVASRIPIGLSALLMTVATQVLVPMFVRDRREGGPRSVALWLNGGSLTRYNTGLYCCPEAGRRGWRRPVSFAICAT